MQSSSSNCAEDAAVVDVATPDVLKEATEFELPFRVLGDGRIHNLADLFVDAPERVTDEAAPEGWAFVGEPSGASEQRGPIMRPSDVLGGSLAAHVLATPGVYCVVEAHTTVTVDDVLGELVDEIANAVRGSIGDTELERLAPADVGRALADGTVFGRSLADAWAAALASLQDEPAGWCVLRMLAADEAKLVEQLRAGVAEGLEGYSRYLPAYTAPLSRWGVVVDDRGNAELVTGEDRAALLAQCSGDAGGEDGMPVGIADLDTGERHALSPVVAIADPFAPGPAAGDDDRPPVYLVEMNEGDPLTFWEYDDAQAYGAIVHADSRGVEYEPAAHYPLTPEQAAGEIANARRDYVEIPNGVQWTGEPGEAIEAVTDPEEPGPRPSGDLAAALAVADANAGWWLVYFDGTDGRDADAIGDRWEISAYPTQYAAVDAVNGYFGAAPHTAQCFAFDGRRHVPGDHPSGIGYTLPLLRRPGMDREGDETEVPEV